MTDAIRCVVAYATRDEQLIWTVELTAPATIADALNAARRSANRDDIPWESAPVGIFGESRTRTDLLRDGDRVELYRPLQADPRVRRREGVRKDRRASRGQTS